jgi:hypothetical protein
MSGLMTGVRAGSVAMVAGVSLAAALLAGCEVDTHKDANGEHVKVATPFGGVQVKTGDSANIQGIGIATYPGAVPTKKSNNDKNSDSADVNVSFGDFKVRVKAASFRSDDSQDRLIAFYRKELGKYGTVIQCSDGQPVGQPTKTPEGLSCDDEHSHGNSDVDGKIELKAGSEQHQHLVAIDPQTNGTKFALIVLDLPIHFNIGTHGSDDK